MHNEIRFMLQVRHGNDGTTIHRTFKGFISEAEVLEILAEAAKVAHVPVSPLSALAEDE